MSEKSAHAPSTLAVVAAFAAVYIIWGSTYLAIRVAVETLPPFLMAGVRFTIAGGVLYAWMRLRGTPAPSRLHWRSALIVGGLLLLGGNGGVCWAEQTVPSGTAALLVSAVPLWMVLLPAIRPGGVRPGGVQIVGIVVGFIGVGILVNPGSESVRGDGHWVGEAVLILASLLWAIGSLYSRQAPLPKSALLSTAMQMLAGGALLGNYLLLLFLAGNGAQSVLANIFRVGPAVFWFAAITITVHGIGIFGVGRLFGIDAGTLAVASQANVGGPASAVALAGARGYTDRVLPGVAVGLLGYAVGNYSGFLVANLARAWLG